MYKKNIHRRLGVRSLDPFQGGVNPSPAMLNILYIA